jgi:LEA14-like dessication related protein
MEKKYQYIVIIVVLLVIGVILIGIFARAPVVSVSGAGITSVNLSAIGLEITLTIDSPYPVAILVKSLDYSVSYHGKESPVLLGEGKQYGLTLQPGSQKIIIPMVVSNQAVIGSLWEGIRSENMNLVITGNITPEFFGIAPAIPFNREVSAKITGRDILSGIGSLAGAFLGS